MLLKCICFLGLPITECFVAAREVILIVLEGVCVIMGGEDSCHLDQVFVANLRVSNRTLTVVLRCGGMWAADQAAPAA